MNDELTAVDIKKTEQEVEYAACSCGRSCLRT